MGSFNIELIVRSAAIYGINQGFIRFINSQLSYGFVSHYQLIVTAILNGERNKTEGLVTSYALKQHLRMQIAVLIMTAFLFLNQINI